MATATELSVNTAASALDMAEAIFGSGIQVVTATYSGSTVSSGIYTVASTTLAGISPTDHGVILSTALPTAPITRGGLFLARGFLLPPGKPPGNVGGGEPPGGE